MIWTQFELPHPSIVSLLFFFFVLVTFLCQGISITLQKMQASSILSQAIAIGLTTSHLPPFQDTPPLTQLIYYKLLVVEMESF